MISFEKVEMELLSHVLDYCIIKVNIFTKLT